MGNTDKNSILIVDDEATNLMFLTHELNPFYTVYTVKDGESAIKKTKEVLPDLILLDIILPGINGYEVMTALGSFEETRDIPIIIITGLGSTEDETKGLSFNAADYISKPFHTEIIKLRVRNQIKIVNQMREIRRLSTIDQLTHIPNRRGFDFQLAREWGRSIREKLPISILMLDVDKFKVYNDAFGHQQGDVVLQEVAKTITNSFGRTTDYGARWGGEEFVVLLPNTALEGAKEVAERIRTRIEDLSIPLANGDATGVTISIGVNSMVPEQGDELSEFIEIADKALYTAKKTGRNRVCHN